MKQERDNHLIATAAEVDAVDFSQAPEGATGYRIAKLRVASEMDDRVAAKWIGDEQFDAVDAPVYFQPRGINAATYVYLKTQQVHRDAARRGGEVSQAGADAIVDDVAQAREDEARPSAIAAETATQANEREQAQERQNYLDGRPRSWRPPGWAARQAKLDAQVVAELAGKVAPELTEEQRRIADRPLVLDEAKLDDADRAALSEPKLGGPIVSSNLRVGENPMVGKVTGYRQLTNAELDLVNAIKAKGQELADLHLKVDELLKARGELAGAFAGMGLDGHGLNKSAESHRWLAIGKTELQQGLMALIRAVAAPGGF